MEEQSSFLESVGLNSDNSFWPDKKVIITGHTGFKGSWLALWLTHLGANVTGYALNPLTEPNLFTVLDIEKNIADDIFELMSSDSIIKSKDTYRLSGNMKLFEINNEKKH